MFSKEKCASCGGKLTYVGRDQWSSKNSYYVCFNKNKQCEFDRHILIFKYGLFSHHLRLKLLELTWGRVYVHDAMTESAYWKSRKNI